MEESIGSRVGDGAGARSATNQPDGPQEKTWRRQPSHKCECKSPTPERSLAKCPQTLKQTLKARQLLSSQNCLLPSVKPPRAWKPRLLPDTVGPIKLLPPALMPTPSPMHPLSHLLHVQGIPGNFQVKHPPLSAQRGDHRAGRHSSSCPIPLEKGCRAHAAHNISAGSHSIPWETQEVGFASASPLCAQAGSLQVGQGQRGHISSTLCTRAMVPAAHFQPQAVGPDMDTLQNSPRTTKQVPDIPKSSARTQVAQLTPKNPLTWLWQTQRSQAWLRAATRPQRKDPHHHDVS